MPIIHTSKCDILQHTHKHQYRIYARVMRGWAPRYSYIASEELTQSQTQTSTFCVANKQTRGTRVRSAPDMRSTFMRSTIQMYAICLHYTLYMPYIDIVCVHDGWCGVAHAHCGTKGPHTTDMPLVEYTPHTIIDTPTHALHTVYTICARCLHYIYTRIARQQKCSDWMEIASFRNAQHTNSTTLHSYTHNRIQTKRTRTIDTRV